MRVRHGLLAVVVALMVAACIPLASGTTIPATGASTEAACMAARVEGELIAHPVSGLGLILADGQLLEVQWAPGYAAVDQVLRDAAGRIVARPGDRIEIGGGQKGPWIACPGTVKVLAKASPGLS